MSSTADDGWVERLPATIAACAERWHIGVGEPLTGGLVGHVFACTTEEGDAAVLKLNPPSSDGFAGMPDQEAAALQAWGGRGAVELLDFAPDLRALLTRRALPGTPLPEGDEGRPLQAVAGVLSQLSAAKIPPGIARLAETVDRQLEGKLAVTADARPVLEPLVEQARASAQRLVASTTHEVLLHGDLMDKNLLLHQDRVLAIDPMPAIGDPCSDIGFWAATRIPAPGVFSRAGELALLLGRDPDRANRWAAVYAVASACETWRPDTVELRELARSARTAELLSS